MTTVIQGDPAAKRRADLRTRMVFGPIMLGVIALVYALDATRTGGKLSAAVIALLAIGGVWEYLAMMRRAGVHVSSLLLVCTAVLVGSAFFFQWHLLDRELYPLAISAYVLLIPLATRSLARGRMQHGLETQGATLLGLVWIGWSLYLAQGMAIRHLPSVLYVVLICKGGDIGGYFVGRTLGRRKLIPHISLGKTVEGACGSMAASCVIAAGLRSLLTPPEAGLGLTASLAIGIMLNLAAQIGDLVESLLKRSCGVKDSSNLLPAHGGILDLVDSLLFAFPAYFLLLVSLT